MSEAFVHCSGVTKRFGDTTAVDDVSLEVERGQTLALLGPSGCGKTTLLRLIAGLERPDAGTISIDGVPVAGDGKHVAPEKRRVGMVFQKPNPFPKSIQDNVVFGAKVNGIKGDSREIAERALKQAALWDEVKNDLKMSGLELSGGQQQRLCIARALAVQPDVILMDEPCSALDPKGTEAIEELIWELRGDYTIVIVTHNMAQARRASDECVFMLLGKVLEHESTEERFLTPKEQEPAD